MAGFGPGLEQPTKLPGAMNQPVSKAQDALAKAGVAHGGILVAPTSQLSGTVTTIVIQGDKDSGKSMAPVGIPNLKGRKVIISCDDTTAESLVNYYGGDIFTKLELYEVTRRITDKDGKVIYPGYDPSRPETAEVVLGNVMLLLDKFQQDGNVEVLIIDHFQALYEQVAATYARHINGLAPDDRMQLEHWGARTDAMKLIEGKIRRVPMAGGVAVISGYGAEEKITYVEVMDASGKPKKKVVRKMVDPKWLPDAIIRNWLVILNMTMLRTTSGLGKEKSSEDRYYCEVVMSKGPRFEKGKEVDITGKNLGIFWESPFAVSA